MAGHESGNRKRTITVTCCLFVLFFRSDLVRATDGETSSSNADDELHSDEDIRHHLEILPETPLMGYALVKRVDDTLNLTCKVVKDSGPIVKFQLEWHVPQPLNNRIHKQILNKQGGLNMLQLTISKLQESDSGRYRCIARGDKSIQLQHSVDITILPKKGTCGDNMFMCSSKTCIPQRYKCDGLRDCTDGVDESQETCGESPCDGKLQCEDGRCISKKVCCDRFSDANCTAAYELPCCSKLLSFLGPEFPLQTHHQFHEIGFLQSTMYTIIGCAVAFVLIVTCTVIAICRVHMRRSALANAYAAYRSEARVWSDLDSYLTASNSRWTRGLLRPDLSRSPGLVLNSFGDSGGPNTSLLVTYNINNGVQLMGRPIEPPPYEEVAGHASNSRDEPPPPYVSRENLNTNADWSRNPAPASGSGAAPAGNAPFLSAIFSLLVNSTSSHPPAGQPVQHQAAAHNAERAAEEDNNNGDINGNNTGQIWVRPDSNNRDNHENNVQPVPQQQQQTPDRQRDRSPPPVV